jgi:predicted phosphodiesterase
MNLPDIRKVMILGDTHGDENFMGIAVNRALAEECDAILQVGDFGYWPRTKSHPILQDYPLPVIFIDGNHEDFQSLGELPKQDMVEIHNNLYYARRGSKQTIGSTNIVFVGGAWSIDHAYRTEGLDVFKKLEQVSMQDVRRATEYTDITIDMVISHDCPLRVNICNDMFPQSLRNRELLDIVYSKLYPEFWYFGHWHRPYRNELKGTLFTCLDCNVNAPVRATLFNTELCEEIGPISIP